MRFFQPIVILLLIFQISSLGNVKDKIKRDFEKRNLVPGKSEFTTRIYTFPSGLQKVQKWVTQGGNLVQSHLIQDSGTVKVTVFFSDLDARYWLRLQGSILHVDLWYGPYTYYGIRRTGAKNFFTQSFQRLRRKDAPTNSPKGLINKTVYMCRRHHEAVKVFDIAYNIKAYYCKSGEQYWIKKNSSWYGPFTIEPVVPVYNLSAYIKLGKRSYSLGESVQVQVFVQNKGAHGIWLLFSSGMQADYVIDNHYKYSSNHFTTFALTKKFIPAYSQIKLLDYWHRIQDYHLKPGNHTIYGVVKPTNFQQLITPVVSFQVKQKYIPFPSYTMDQALRFIKKRKYKKARIALKSIIAREPRNATAYYNLACVESLCFKVNLALTYLEKAVALGFNDYEHIEDDSDLDNIRYHPRYKELMYSYSSKR